MFTKWNAKILAAGTPAIFDFMPMDAYHGAIGYSSTQLKKVLRSPAHFWTAEQNKQSDQSANLGTAVHCLMEGDGAWGREIFVMPKVDRRTGKGKADYAAALKDAEGRMVLNEDQANQTRRAAAAILSHKIASGLIADTTPEVSLFCEHNNVLWKSRPDAISSQKQIIIDYKTTSDARPHVFGKQADRLDYHLSAAMQLDAAEQCYGVNFDYIWIAVELDPPNGVMIYHHDEDSINAGRERYLTAIDMVAEFLETGKAKCYPEKIAPLYSNKIRRAF